MARPTIHRLLLLTCTIGLSIPARAAEPWADSRLPITEGLQIWLDAAQAEGGDPLPESDASLTHWPDASGNRRDVLQSEEKRQPRLQRDLVPGKLLPLVAFDGQDDSFCLPNLNQRYRDLTVFIVAAPRTNAGGFRGLLAVNRKGVNDYTSGLTIDLHAFPSLQFNAVNVEGAGFGGAVDLLDANFALGTFHVLTSSFSPGSPGVKLFVDGKPSGQRDRAESVLRADELRVGVRHYSNTAEPTFDQGFFDGHIAEILIYNRVLPDDQRKSVEAYLAEKHAELLKFVPANLRDGKPLLTVENPPEVQVLVPGFAVRRLPLQLPNINNVRYRSDGKLVAQAYDGNLYLLSDTDNDGLEDHADLWWDNSSGALQSPIGIALTPPNYPHGSGVFVAGKGKLSLLTDTDSDDRLDRERVVATGWTQLPHNVDALGVAMAPDGAVFFGLGCTNFASAYLTDDKGQGHYDLRSERGTILRVAPDLNSRQIYCTGIRFPVGMAFNGQGDLFCTDQEGATWLSNGNPFDELLHIQPDRHFGFPPRHPKHLPKVIDEPSTFDFAPQHQSTCGLAFNEPAGTGSVFGPAAWRGDALTAGYSRGKIWRTRLAKTSAGYVAQNHLLACLQMLTADVCLGPRGDLAVACHSGGPDWGSGPSGKGALYKISYVDREVPQPAYVWCSAPDEVRIAFNKPLRADSLQGLRNRITIEGGKYVAAGDRFETLRPGYAVVAQQMVEPRFELKVYSVALTPDSRTLVLSTERHRPGLTYSITMPKPEGRTDKARPYEIPQRDEMDLQYDLHGIEATWEPEPNASKVAQLGSWTGILPHFDLSVVQRFTAGSAEHMLLFSRLQQPGNLTFRGQIVVDDMLRPKVQPGSTLDYQWPPESVTVELTTAGSARQRKQRTTEYNVAADQPKVIDVDLPIEWRRPGPINVSWWTNEDKRKRPLPLSRITHHRLGIPSSESDSGKPLELSPPPELTGGDWLRGREVFRSEAAVCSKCHTVDGEGGAIGPNLSNLRHRDYASVLRDIAQPSYALNPDYINYSLLLADGRALAGVVRSEGDSFRLGDAKGNEILVAKSDVEEMKPQSISVMPEGLPAHLGPERMRDLLTFLLMAPPAELAPAPINRPGAPPARTKAEIDAVLAGSEPLDKQKLRQLEIILVSGPKDHGINEHDYPDWQKRWSKLLALAPQVKVDTAEVWPSPEQLRNASVLVWYSANPAWTPEKAKELDAFQARGGGMVYLHFAVNGQRAPEQLAERIGLAWRDGSKFRHGPVDLRFTRDARHPIVRNFTAVKFEDEAYWNLLGDLSKIQVLATSDEEGEARPLLWAYEHNQGRVFGSILGHYSWTFDDPLFRTLVLRGIAWTTGEPVDRFNDLVTIGARVSE